MPCRRSYLIIIGRVITDYDDDDADADDDDDDVNNDSLSLELAWSWTGTVSLFVLYCTEEGTTGFYTTRFDGTGYSLC